MIVKIIDDRWLANFVAALLSFRIHSLPIG